MKHVVLSTAITLMTSFSAAAATITTVVEAGFQLPGFGEVERQSETIDTSTGVTTQDLIVSTDTGEATAKTNAIALQFDISSRAYNYGESTPSTRWARSRTDLDASYRALATGTITLTLDTTMFGFLSTDRDDGLDLIHNLAGFEVMTPTESLFLRTSNLDPANPVLDSRDYA